MTGGGSKSAVAFAIQQSIFGAYDAQTSELVFVVESETDIEALFNVDSVAPLLGYGGVWELVVCELEVVPSDVPSFLKAFFDAKNFGSKRCSLVTGTSTIQ